MFTPLNKGHKHVYCQKKYGFSSAGCTIRIGTTCKEMTQEQIKIRYEQKFIDTEYMLRKKSGLLDLSFRELKIYYSEKRYRLDDNSFETNLNSRIEAGEYNLLAELLADRNNIPFIFVKFKGENKTYISDSDTTERPRKDIYLFDYDAVNEAVLNSLVHNNMGQMYLK